MSTPEINSPLVTLLLLLIAAPLLGQTVAPATQDQMDQLINVLQSADASQNEKAAACRQLAIMGTKEVVPALAALLGDEKLSHMARYGLEPIPDPAVDESLRQALGRLKGRPLVGVIGSLGARRDAQAVPALAKMLQDSDADVVQGAARALGKIGTSDAAKALQQALAKAPAKGRPAIADACLGCAEALLVAGKHREAAALYDSVGKAELPTHFRVAAAHGALRARQSTASP